MKEGQGAHSNGNTHRLARRLRRQHYLMSQAAEPPALAPQEPDAPAGQPQAHGAAHAHSHAHAPKHPPIAELEKMVDTLREQLARNQAEFDNYRKRQRRDEQQRLELANQGLMEQILPVIDNFGRALANPGDSVQGLLSGLVMVQNQLSEILRQNGLEKVEAQGQPFDPNKHEAVSVETTDAAPEGQVLEVFQDGYTLKGRLVRPAMVKVARHA